MRFPLEVVKRVKDTVGDVPVGYRFLADEWLPDGLGLEESRVFAGALEKTGVAYLSVMGGTYESFFLPEVVARSRKTGHMAALAGAIREVVRVPVIAAGRSDQVVERGEDEIACGDGSFPGLPSCQGNHDVTSGNRERFPHYLAKHMPQWPRPCASSPLWPITAKPWGK